MTLGLTLVLKQNGRRGLHLELSPLNHVLSGQPLQILMYSFPNVIIEQS